MDPLASSSLLLLLLLECCAGQDLLPPGPVDALVGGNVTLHTQVTDPDYSFIVWSFNNGTDTSPVTTLPKDKPLNTHAPYEGRVAVDPRTGSLSLATVRPSDSGDYSLSILTSVGGTSTGEVQLRVLEPVSDVSITSNVNEAIEHNSTVVLTCSSKGSFITFSWTNGTEPIAADGKRISIDQGEFSSNVTFSNVLRSDLVGPIYCSVKNKLETKKSAPFNLTVYYGPENVSIAPAPPPQFVESGSDFNLTCSAVSKPAATFSWYHQKQLMDLLGPVLTLEEIQKRGLGTTAGDFSCVANNAKTKMDVSSDAVSFTVMDSILDVKVTGPTGVLIAGNSTANISCQATGGNVSTTEWLKDGERLTAGDRLKFAKDQSSVAIDPLQKEDGGLYTCRMSNPISTKEASYKMEVNYGPEAAEVKGEAAVEINDKVTLVCAAASVPPADYSWKFNGTMTQTKTATYTIEKAVYTNTGIYTCEAHNAVTGMTSVANHKLAVKAEGALDGLSGGAIAGIIIGVLVALGIAIGLVVYCRQKVPLESPY